MPNSIAVRTKLTSDRPRIEYLLSEARRRAQPWTPDRSIVRDRVALGLGSARSVLVFVVAGDEYGEDAAGREPLEPRIGGRPRPRGELRGRSREPVDERAQTRGVEVLEVASGLERRLAAFHWQRDLFDVRTDDLRRRDRAPAHDARHDGEAARRSAVEFERVISAE